jgi:hypothetical protein
MPAVKEQTLTNSESRNNKIGEVIYYSTARIKWILER